MTYLSTKTYGHEIGLSAVFRQWKATSHCNQLHGYALAFKFVFEAEELDHRNWVVDFGGLKQLKKMLQLKFDHKLVVDQHDPAIDTLLQLKRLNIADVEVVDGVGCERFAYQAYRMAQEVLEQEGYAPRVKVRSVECSEHGANSAIYEPNK